MDVPDKIHPEFVRRVLIGDELKNVLKNEIQLLEDAVKKDPIESKLEENVKIENFVKSLKENYDKNGKQHYTFDKDGKQIGFTDTYEALKNGDPVRLDSFNDRSFIGFGQILKFDKKQMRVAITEEKSLPRCKYHCCRQRRFHSDKEAAPST